MAGKHDFFTGANTTAPPMLAAGGSQSNVWSPANHIADNTIGTGSSTPET